MLLNLNPKNLVLHFDQILINNHTFQKVKNPQPQPQPDGVRVH